MIHVRENKESTTEADAVAETQPDSNEQSKSNTSNFSIEAAGKFTSKLIGADRIVLSVRGADRDEVRLLGTAKPWLL